MAARNEADARDVCSVCWAEGSVQLGSILVGTGVGHWCAPGWLGSRWRLAVCLGPVWTLSRQSTDTHKRFRKHFGSLVLATKPKDVDNTSNSNPVTTSGCFHEKVRFSTMPLFGFSDVDRLLQLFKSCFIQHLIREESAGINMILVARFMTVGLLNWRAVGLRANRSRWQPPTLFCPLFLASGLTVFDRSL